VKLAALVTLALVAAACGSAPRTAVVSDAPTVSSDDAQLFSMDKGYMFPITNGARLPIENGWIEPHISPFPPHRSADVDIVVVGDGKTDAAAADVTMSYEMLEMAHGATTVRAEPESGGHHLVHMAMGMYGTWQIKVRVVLDGVTSTSVLMLTGAGL
jgi:hypothetical protein